MARRLEEPIAASSERSAAALSVCVDLAALGPQPSVEAFVAAGHTRIGMAIDATTGYVALGARRREDADDPLVGFRLDAFYVIGPSIRRHVVAVEQDVEAGTYLHDPVVQRVVRNAGRHRVYHDADPRTVPELRDVVDVRYWELLGLVDRLKLVHAVSRDVEIHLAFDRREGAPVFEGGDELLLRDVANGIGPWAQRLALIHGYGEGRSPLSPRERQVACALLGLSPIKTIAYDLGMSEPWARELVRAVYRKLRVSGRSELLVAWASRHVVAPAYPAAPTQIRRRR